QSYREIAGDQTIIKNGDGKRLICNSPREVQSTPGRHVIDVCNGGATCGCPIPNGSNGAGATQASHGNHRVRVGLGYTIRRCGEVKLAFVFENIQDCGGWNVELSPACRIGEA